LTFNILNDESRVSAVNLAPAVELNHDRGVIANAKGVAGRLNDVGGHQHVASDNFDFHVHDLVGLIGREIRALGAGHVTETNERSHMRPPKSSA
jgi:hypothetical protein